MLNEDKSNSFVHSKAFIVLLGFLIAFGPLTIDMYLPALPILSTELNTTTSMTQLSLTATLLGLGIGQVIFGSYSDIYGRKKPLIIALSLYIVASVLCAFAPNIWLLVLFRFIQGLAGAGGMVIARSCARDLYTGSQLTKVFSLLILVMGIAPIIAPVIGGQLLHFISWRGIFIVLALLGVSMLIATQLRLPETLSTENRSLGGIRNTMITFKGLFSNSLFMSYATIQALVTGSMFAYIAGSAFIYQDIFAVSPQVYSIFFAMNAAGLIIASQITGRLAGRVSELKLLKFALVFASFGSVLLLTSFLLKAGIVLVTLALFIVISSVGIVNPTCISLAMQSQGKNAGSASALIGLIQFTIGGTVAPLAGIAGSQNTLPLGIIIATCVLIAMILYFTVVPKNLRNSTHSNDLSA